MNIKNTQLGLFGDDTEHQITTWALKFYIKKHLADRAGLYYDLCLQAPRIVGIKADMSIVKSFAITPGPSLHVTQKSVAIMMDDHDISSMRREGNILYGIGQGSILHFDEGYYTIQGCKTMKELMNAFDKGLKKGSITLFFDGYKINGSYQLYRKPRGAANEWIFQKMRDEYASKRDILLLSKSILTGLPIEHYIELYKQQRAILPRLSPAEQDKFLKDNEAASFDHTWEAKPRPFRSLPFD